VDNENPEGFFARLLADESWFHYHTNEKKKQSMQQKHNRRPWPKKFQITPAVGKQMASGGDGGHPAGGVTSSGDNSLTR
jgi:hypothetical protein